MKNNNQQADKQEVNSYDSVAEKYHNSLNKGNNFFNTYVEEPGTLAKLNELDLKNKRILDLGCGSGRYSIVLKDKGAIVTGIDPSEELLKIARETIPEVKFICVGADKLPFGNETFDIVFAGMVLHYIKDIDKAFREISRVLKPGGIFVYTSHVPYLGLARRVKFEGKPYYEFGNYFDEGEHYKNWGKLGVKILYVQHTMESIIRATLNNSFVLSDYRDLQPLQEGKEVDPGDWIEATTKSKFYLAEFTKK